MDLSNFLVNPVTLSLIVLGVVEFIKKFGVTGNKLMLVAMFVYLGRDFPNKNIRDSSQGTAAGVLHRHPVGLGLQKRHGGAFFLR